MNDDEALDAGFDYFEGTLLRHNAPGNLPGATNPPYEDFAWTTANGVEDPSTERYCRVDPGGGLCDHPIADIYLTKHTVEAAIDWIQATSGPWFVYLALQAPHSPWYCPPADAYLDPDFPWGGCLDAEPTDLDKYYGMLQVVDEQVDRLLNLTEVAVNTDTYVFILSDNGSPADVALTPVDPNKAKGTVSEGGVRVPFFAGGPDLVDGVVADDLIINVSDLYGTILDLADLSNPRTSSWELAQSQSFEPYLVSSSPNRVRDCVYTEYFMPNGDPVDASAWDRTVAGVVPAGNGDVFKYIQKVMGAGLTTSALMSGKAATSVRVAAHP